jgi:cell division protein FtsL
MSMYRDNLARPLQKPQEKPSYTPKQNAVPKRSPQSRAVAREKLLWLGTILFCVIIALALVGRYAGMVSLNYSVQDQKDKLQGLNDNKLKLEQQMLELESPDRIKSYAQNKLGMKPVEQNQVVILPGSAN